MSATHLSTLPRSTVIRNPAIFPWWRRCLRSMLHWLLILPLSLALVACGGSGDGDSSPVPPDPTPPVSRAKTTVLVYMLGTDLESNSGSATYNLQEMQKVGSNGDVNVIIQSGGANKDGWRTNQRKRVIQGGVEPIADIGTLNMTAGATLRDFIVWGVESYPADRYQLVLWNHGGGPNGGFGPDEVYRKIDPQSPYTMSLDVMAQALAQAKAQTGATFEMIGFDACLMASVEIAQALSPYAKYMVASQDIEPGRGWDWTKYLEHLRANPLSSGSATGKAIADGYIAKMQAPPTEDTMIVLSVTDLSRIGALTQAIADVADSLNGNFQDAGSQQAQASRWLDLAFLRRISLDFYSPRFYFEDVTDLVDIGDFFGHFQWEPLLQVPQAKLDAVQQALSQAVVYNVMGDDMRGASGLTMFFPATGYDLAQDFATLKSVPEATKSLVTQFAKFAKTPGALPQLALGKPVLDSQGQVIRASVQEGAMQAIPFAALRSADQITYAIKPLDAPPTSADQEGTIAASVQNGWFYLNGIAVLMLPDDHRFAVGTGRHTIPVVRHRTYANGLTQEMAGMLLVDIDLDAQGNETFSVDSFVGSSSSIASRSEGLHPSDVFYPIMLTATGQKTRDSSRKIVSLSAEEAQFEISLEQIPREAQQDVALGVLDLVNNLHFTDRLQ